MKGTKAIAMTYRFVKTIMLMSTVNMRKTITIIMTLTIAVAKRKKKTTAIVKMRRKISKKSDLSYVSSV